MKKIIKKGKIEIVTFTCNRCGQVWESDEYVFRTAVAVNDSWLNDNCPLCGKIAYHDYHITGDRLLTN